MTQHDIQEIVGKKRIFIFFMAVACFVIVLSADVSAGFGDPCNYEITQQDVDAALNQGFLLVLISPGVWCLSEDIYVRLGSGTVGQQVIAIATLTSGPVTLDLRGFSIINTAADKGQSTAITIGFSQDQPVLIGNGRISGFQFGIWSPNVHDMMRPEIVDTIFEKNRVSVDLNGVGKAGAYIWGNKFYLGDPLDDVQFDGIIIDGIGAGEVDILGNTLRFVSSNSGTGIRVRNIGETHIQGNDLSFTDKKVSNQRGINIDAGDFTAYADVQMNIIENLRNGANGIDLYNIDSADVMWNYIYSGLQGCQQNPLPQGHLSPVGIKINGGNTRIDMNSIIGKLSQEIKVWDIGSLGSLASATITNNGFWFPNFDPIDTRGANGQIIESGNKNYNQC